MANHDGRAILVVDDEPQICAITSEMLRNLGYKTLQAYTAAAALDICSKLPGDIGLVLTDVVMPSMNGPELADRLRQIRESLDVEAAVAAGRPYVVSVILDGENAWEHYDDDGIDFLSALYQRLNDADWIATITPTDYLARFGEPEALPGDVWPGAWFQPNFATWIGEAGEAAAWDYLHTVR